MIIKKPWFEITRYHKMDGQWVDEEMWSKDWKPGLLREFIGRAGSCPSEVKLTDDHVTKKVDGVWVQSVPAKQHKRTYVYEYVCSGVTPSTAQRISDLVEAHYG